MPSNSPPSQHRSRPRRRKPQDSSTTANPSHQPRHGRFRSARSNYNTDPNLDFVDADASLRIPQSRSHIAAPVQVATKPDIPQSHDSSSSTPDRIHSHPPSASNSTSSLSSLVTNAPSSTPTHLPIPPPLHGTNTDTESTPVLHPTTLSENLDLQREESLALSAIFGPDFSLSPSDTSTGTIRVPIDLPHPTIAVHIGPSPSKSTTTSSSSTPRTTPTTITVGHLPPISLRFQFPATYPSHSCVDFVVDASWLGTDTRAEVADRLGKLWEENEGVPCLFSFAEYLRSTFLSDLALISYPSDLAYPLLTLPSSSSQNKMATKTKGDGHGDGEDADADADTERDTERDRDVLDHLVAYDKKMEQVAFEGMLFSCGVCFNELRGSACIRFDPCKHVFCSDCSRDYFSVKIEDDIDQVGLCFDVSCTKRRVAHTEAQLPWVGVGEMAADETQEREPGPTEGDTEREREELRGQVPRAGLRVLLGDDLFDRYDALWQKKQLEARTDICFCPRPFCQAPANIHPGENKEQTGVSVPYANGPGMEAAPEFATYLKATHDNDMQQVVFYEKRYGEKIMRKMARDWENERESRKWLVENSKDCPECGLHVEKSEGCNHMTCSRCKTHFCYLCGAWLSSSKPYAHFNQPGTACYQNLFNGVAPDLMPEEWGDVGGFEEEQRNFAVDPVFVEQQFVARFV
ncbi:E3 ubiquitin-protein ligase rnf14 [Gonapodya sp. JEL0774]|nr:E3 ubiquitin-protein ligase rnf14 [Gonapodya sp. JEL0774]